MSRPRFLTDQDFNQQIVDGLRRREPAIDFVSVRDVGLDTQPDPLVLEYAAANGLILLSHDVNTMRAHAYDRLANGRAMTGLFLVHQSQPVRPVIESLVLIWSGSDAGEWVGQVVFLPL